MFANNPGLAIVSTLQDTNQLWNRKRGRIKIDKFISGDEDTKNDKIYNELHEFYWIKLSYLIYVIIIIVMIIILCSTTVVKRCRRTRILRKLQRIMQILKNQRVPDI